MMQNQAGLDDLYGRGLADFRSGFSPGEKIEGEVTGITSNAVFLDIRAKSEGIIERQELLDENGELTVRVGDRVVAYFRRMDRGEIILSVKLGGQDADDDDLAQAAASQIPVEGRVESERKGGFVVRIGKRQGFCPYSQIDVYGAQDKSVYLGERFTFAIIEYDGDNLVLSRRQLLEAEQAARRSELQQSLKEGDVVEGTVMRLMDFGAFVDVGGVEGLIPMSEIAWQRVKRAEDVLQEGDRVRVMIKAIDWDRDRISLSRRISDEDPWLTVEQDFPITSEHHGVVTRLTDFGAFVSVKHGVEGLVHISKLGAGKRLRHASEVLEEGQELAVYVENIDLERRRMSLVLENPQQGRTMELDGEALTVGATVTGTVEDVKPFGVFIKISAVHTGLLHVSEIDLSGPGNRHREMFDRFRPGSAQKVLIKAIHGDRISLALPDVGIEEAESYRVLLQDQGADSLGSLGSLFDGLSKLGGE